MNLIAKPKRKVQYSRPLIKHYEKLVPTTSVYTQYLIEEHQVSWRTVSIDELARTTPVSPIVFPVICYSYTHLD